MRMVALVDAIAEAGGDACWCSAQLDEALVRRVTSRGVPFDCCSVRPGSDADVEWVVREAVRRGAQWVAADGYAFGERFQDGLRRAGIPLLLMDDYRHCARYAAELIVNPNASATEALYGRRADTTRLLLGPSYALLRGEFRRRAPREPSPPDRATRILVTMGAADPVNATQPVVQALLRLPDPTMRAKVVVGPSGLHGAELAGFAQDPRIELLQPVDDMADVMSWADLAVAAAGSTAAELCFMGVPAMLVVLSDGHREVAHALGREGVCEDLGWYHELNPNDLARRIEALCTSRRNRQNMIERGQRLVDGRGAGRVVTAMGAAA